MAAQIQMPRWPSSGTPTPFVCGVYQLDLMASLRLLGVPSLSKSFTACNHVCLQNLSFVVLTELAGPVIDSPAQHLRAKIVKEQILENIFYVRLLWLSLPKMQS